MKGNQTGANTGRGPIWATRKWMPSAKRLAGVLAGVTVLLGSGVLASEDDVNYRQHAMSAVGGHMQAVGEILRGNVPHTEHMQGHADALAALAQMAPALFAEGTEGGDSLPAIWENAEDFQAKLTAFKEAADGLKAAVAEGSGRMGLGRAAQALGGACKGCHDDYRAQ